MYMYVCVYNEIKPPQTVIENFVHALKSQTNAENVEQMFQYLQSLQWAAKLLSLLLYNFFAREKGMWVSACRRRPGVRPAWRVQWLVPLPSTGSPLHRRPGPAGVNLCVLCITAALQHCSTAALQAGVYQSVISPGSGDNHQERWATLDTQKTSTICPWHCG